MKTNGSTAECRCEFAFPLATSYSFHLWCERAFTFAKRNLFY